MKTYTTKTGQEVGFPVQESLIGKYINRRLWTDIQPIGKIIGLRGKSIAIVQRVEAGENKVKMDFEVGGFSAVCTNQTEQRYDYTLKDEVIEVRISQGFLKQVSIDDKPYKYYDYNF
jgi:hypothetical protein